MCITSGVAVWTHTWIHINTYVCTYTDNAYKVISKNQTCHWHLAGLKSKLHVYKPLMLA